MHHKLKLVNFRFFIKIVKILDFFKKIAFRLAHIYYRVYSVHVIQSMDSS